MPTIIRALVVIFFAVTFFLALYAAAFAHEHDRTDPAWEATPPEVQEWYKRLMMPDVPTASCCGEADAYWCDIINVREGKTFCTITDDRPDEPFKRPHINLGTEIEIPNHKLKWDRGNP